MSSAPEQGTVVFRLSEYGSVLVTRDQGAPIRDALLCQIDRSKKVEVVLDDVEAYTPSFVDEVLGKCLQELGIVRFREKVTLTASSQQNRKLVNLVLSNRAGNRATR